MTDRHVIGDLVNSAGAIVFRKTDSGVFVLMIQSAGGSWSFPKGHIEMCESEAVAALREVFEETGITAELVGSFRADVPSARRGDNRTVTFFLGSYVGGELAPQSGEVSEAVWIPAPEAADMISYLPDREAYLGAEEAFARIE